MISEQSGAYTLSSQPKTPMRTILSASHALLIRLLFSILAPLGDPKLVQILCNGLLYGEAYDPFVDKALLDVESDLGRAARPKSSDQGNLL